METVSRQLLDDPKELVDRQSLGIPILRESHLPDHPSSFEILVAAPSDDELHTMWIVWAVVFTVYSAIILVVFLGIVHSRRVRKQIFNHYLIYLMLPDILYTVLCTVQCGTLAITGGHNTPASCRLQSFYLIFGNGANSWMNAIIANQIHTLLKISHRGERYIPPTKRWVALQALCAYAFAAFIAILGILPTSAGVPIMTVPFYGLGCVPVSYDKQSNLFFWLFFYPAFAAVPMAYLIYVTVDIWRKKLLPRKGRRRQLSLYYVRILVAVYVMWLPALVTIYGVSVGALPFMLVGLWIHAQGAVSALFSLMKEDISRAVRNLLCCRCSEENKKEVQRPGGGSHPRTSRSEQQSVSLSGSSHYRDRLQRGLTRKSFVQISGFSSEMASSGGGSFSSLNPITRSDQGSAPLDRNSIEENVVVDDGGDRTIQEEDSSALHHDSLQDITIAQANAVPFSRVRNESLNSSSFEEDFEIDLNDNNCKGEDSCSNFDVEKGENEAPSKEQSSTLFEE